MRRGWLNQVFVSSALAPLAGTLGLVLSVGCGTVDAGDSSGGMDGNPGGTTTTGIDTNDDEMPGTTGNVTSDSQTSGMDETGGPGMTFIENPDGGGINNECDVWTQDCPAGEKCMPWANDGGGSWNATRCSPIDANPAQPGDPCTVEGSGVSGIDNCDISAMCWDVDPETNVGICVGFCEGSQDAPLCSNPDDGCSISNEGVLILCLPFCDPLLQDCIEGQACYPEENGFICSPDASGPDLGAYGDPCEFLNVCDPGFWCADAETVPGCVGAIGCCASYCDVSEAMPDCEPGTECVPWYEKGTAPPGEEDYGVCIIAQ